MIRIMTVEAPEKIHGMPADAPVPGQVRRAPVFERLYAYISARGALALRETDSRWRQHVETFPRTARRGRCWA